MTEHPDSPRPSGGEAPAPASPMARLRAWLAAFRTQIAAGPIQNAWPRGKWAYRALFVVVAIGIVFWQSTMLEARETFDKSAARTQTTGFNHKWARHFLYHYYYNDLFPVVSLNHRRFKPADYSDEGARRQLTEHGRDLVQEVKHWSRFGAHNRILAYLPSAWLDGSPRKPSVLGFNVFIFTLALLSVWLSFWYHRRAVLGLLIVVLVGSSPFLLWEVYRNQNLFHLMASGSLLLLATHLPLFEGGLRRRHVVIPVFAGLLVGTLVHMRGEVIAIAGGAALVYLVQGEARWFQRLAMTGLLVLSLQGTKHGWAAYWDHKWEESTAVVVAAGGNPYTGHRTGGHPLWHPVFCGLGDFDDKYGYKWHDVVAYRYAVPIMRKKYGLKLKYRGGYALLEHYDEKRRYYKKLEPLPEYGLVVKDKVLHDIKTDPWWYLEILGQRVVRIFEETTRAEVRFKSYTTSFPFIDGWFALPVLAIAAISRSWFYVKLLLFTAPLAASCFLIYSGGNATHVSIFHLIALAIVGVWALEALLGVARRMRREPPRATSSGETGGAEQGEPGGGGALGESVVDD